MTADPHDSEVIDLANIIQGLIAGKEANVSLSALACCTAVCIVTISETQRAADKATSLFAAGVKTYTRGSWEQVKTEVQRQGNGQPWGRA